MTTDRRVTIYDVARRAYVSHGTVSRVLNDRPDVSPRTRALVHAAIDELGFTRNEVAHALRSTKPTRKVIGVLAEQLAETGPAGNTVAALAELESAGYRVVLATVSGDVGASVSRALRDFDGVVSGILALAQSATMRDVLRQRRPPVPIYIDRFLDRGTPDRPGVEELIGRAAAEHLCEQGHRRVLHVPGPVGALSAVDRQDAFVERATGLGMDVEIGAAGDWTSASGYDAAVAVRADEHDAVFAANDAMALGLLHGLRDRGIDVPGRVAVLGVDDIPEARHVDPSLSSIGHDLGGEGRFASRSLISAIEGTSPPEPFDCFRVYVARRASTSLNTSCGQAETRDR